MPCCPPSPSPFHFRWLRTAACLAAILCFSGLSRVAAPAHARSLEEIRSSGELRACFSPIHASIVVVEPPGCRENCRFTGPAPEIMEAFAASLGNGIRVRGVRVGWDEQFFDVQGRTVRDAEYTPELLASGKCDVYPNNLSNTPWRLKKIDVVTMFSNRRIVLIRADRKDRFRKASDLAGAIAAVEKDTSYHSWLQEQNLGTYAANPVDIRLMPTDEVLRHILDGQADFTVIDADAAFWIIRHQFDGLHMAFPVGVTDELGWGVRKQDRDLRDAIDAFFIQQRTDPNSTLNGIWNRYFGMNLNQFISLLGSIHE